LNLGGAVYDPTDPVGRLLFNVLGMVAEFEADLIRARTREGMAIAKAAGKLRGRKPKLTVSQEKHLVSLYRAGGHTTSVRGGTLNRVPGSPARRRGVAVSAGEWERRKRASQRWTPRLEKRWSVSAVSKYRRVCYAADPSRGRLPPIAGLALS
jgi:hypothetical protein